MCRWILALLLACSAVHAGPVAEGFSSLCQKVLEVDLPAGAFPYRIVRQTMDYTCGPACVKSTLRRFGVGHPMMSDLEFAAALGTSEKNGTVPERVVNLLLSQGFDARLERDLDLFKLEGYLSARHVVLAMMDGVGVSRWVVVVGMDPFSVFYMDPSVDSNHYLRMTQLDFEDHWLDPSPTRTLRRAAVVVRTH